VSKDEPADEGESLVEAFWRVARLLRHTSRESLAPWDITPSSARALAVLERHGVMRLSELSEHLRIAARSTTEVVDSLQDRGLVERRNDPDDRRATLVALTDEGTRVGVAIQAARTRDAERLFGALNAGDRAQLAAILRKLADEAGTVNAHERKAGREPRRGTRTSQSRGARRR
jgi:DNA-binding MarR family transcriptional regulator